MSTFHALFPAGFEGILPVRPHRVRAPPGAALPLFALSRVHPRRPLLAHTTETGQTTGMQGFAQMDFLQSHSLPAVS